MAGPMTVTATQGGSTNNGMLLTVRVLTGTAVTQNGATGTQSGSAAHQASVTTTVTGSIVYGTGHNFANTALTINAQSTQIADVADGTHTEHYGTCRATAATGTPGAITIGWSAPAQGGGAAFAEILPNGTIVEDGSAPPDVSTTTAITVTSNSFTPPDGALLVALVSTNGGASVTTMTVSGGGLVWTELAKSNVANLDYAGVWVAQVPAGGGGAFVYGPPSYMPGLPGMPGGTPFEIFPQPGYGQPAQPTIIPLPPWLPRRHRPLIPAPAFRHLQKVPAVPLVQGPARKRPAVQAGRPRPTQQPIPVQAPVVAVSVYAPARVRPSMLQPQRRIRQSVPVAFVPPARPAVRRQVAVPAVRRQNTMPLFLQVSGPPPAIRRVGPYARWTEIRRRPRALMPPLLQVSGPALPPRQPPTRRFVAYPPQPKRRQLALPTLLLPFRRRLVLPLPWLRPRRQAQLAPPVVVVVQPTMPNPSRSRLAAWFGLRPVRRQQMAPPAPSGQPLPIFPVSARPRKAAWFGTRPIRRASLPPSGAAPPPVAVLPLFGRSLRRLALVRSRPQPLPVVPPTALPLPSRKPRSQAGQRLGRTGGIPRGMAVPPRQAPARTRPGAPRLRPQAQLGRPPVLAKPPPLGQQGSRARLTTFLRRLLRRSLNIFGQPPPPPVVNFPGFVTVTNFQVEPVILGNAAASVAVTDRAIGSVAISNLAPGVTITNKEVGQVGVTNV